MSQVAHVGKAGSFDDSPLRPPERATQRGRATLQKKTSHRPNEGETDQSLQKGSFLRKLKVHLHCVTHKKD